MKIYLVILTLLAAPFQWLAQEKKQDKKLGVLPVPTFGYAPETKFYAGVVALFTLRHWSDSNTRVSNAKLETSYTQNKQFVTELGFNLFSPKEKYNAEGSVSWRYFPEYWWGMGNNSHDSCAALYDARRLEADIRVARQVAKHVFAGLRYKMMWMYDVANTGDADKSLAVWPGSEGGTYNGIGPAVNYDSRKNNLNPRQGSYARVSVMAFAKQTLSHSDFLRVEAEYRKYIPLRENKDVLALHAYTLLHPGQPPFRLTGLLGGDREMRGYYQGRYRDQYYFSLQAEYRLHLFWRLGMAAFAGAGDVRGTYSSNHLNLIKPSYGLGLRFLTSKTDDVNLRVDMAFGRNSKGIYIAFGEAF